MCFVFAAETTTNVNITVFLDLTGSTADALSPADVTSQLGPADDDTMLSLLTRKLQAGGLYTEDMLIELMGSTVAAGGSRRMLAAVNKFLLTFQFRVARISAVLAEEVRILSLVWGPTVLSCADM